MPGAYYNEHDPKAAAWLRALIAEKVIADGTVDERSIVDVRPADLAGFDQCHFFAGIGGWSYALRLAGWPDDRRVWTGSCPCQPFSTAGKGDGFADERHLWPAFHWLIQQCGPGVVFGEQVESPAGRAWFDLVCTDLEATGYACGAVDLPAASVGAPHIRQRLFWVADNGSAGWRSSAGSHDGGARAEEIQRGAEEFRRSGVAGWLADREHRTSISGVGGNEASPRGLHDRPNTGGCSGALGMVGAGLSPGRAELEHESRGGARRGTSEADTAGAGPAGESYRLVDGLYTRLERHGGDGHGGVESRRLAPDATRSVAATGATRGPWADADWLCCRDEKFRPVEPGTFPLGHGLPARVGRLRGYGNAIVSELAAEIILAYDEGLM